MKRVQCVLEGHNVVVPMDRGQNDAPLDKRDDARISCVDDAKGAVISFSAMHIWVCESLSPDDAVEERPRSLLIQNATRERHGTASKVFRVLRSTKSLHSWWATSGWEITLHTGHRKAWDIGDVLAGGLSLSNRWVVDRIYPQGRCA